MSEIQNLPSVFLLTAREHRKWDKWLAHSTYFFELVNEYMNEGIKVEDCGRGSVYSWERSNTLKKFLLWKRFKESQNWKETWWLFCLISYPIRESTHNTWIYKLQSQKDGHKLPGLWEDEKEGPLLTQWCPQLEGQRAGPIGGLRSCPWVSPPPVPTTCRALVYGSGLFYTSWLFFLGAYNI